MNEELSYLRFHVHKPWRGTKSAGCRCLMARRNTMITEIHEVSWIVSWTQLLCPQHRPAVTNFNISSLIQSVLNLHYRIPNLELQERKMFLSLYIIENVLVRGPFKSELQWNCSPRFFDQVIWKVDLSHTMDESPDLSSSYSEVSGKRLCLSFRFRLKRLKFIG